MSDERGDWTDGPLEVLVIGTKQECLAWIESVWTDTRPRSLRGET